jgi:membrane associated rhomboid family serine protease
MVLNIGVFLLGWLLGVRDEWLFSHFGLIPYRMTESLMYEPTLLPWSILTVFTSMFLHGGLLHILGNMMFLYIFGRVVEESLGSRKTVWLYIISGIAAAFLQVVTNPWAPVPMIGASGAISGVFAAALFLRPRDRIMIMTPFLLFIPISLQIITFGVVWIGFQFVMGLGAAYGIMDEGIAFWAHIGGFIGGFLLTLSFSSMTLRQWIRELKRVRRPAYSGAQPSVDTPHYSMADLFSMLRGPRKTSGPNNPDASMPFDDGWSPRHDSFNRIPPEMEFRVVSNPHTGEIIILMRPRKPFL